MIYFKFEDDVNQNKITNNYKIDNGEIFMVDCHP